MKLFLISGIIMLGCGPVRSGQTALSSDSVIVTQANVKFSSEALQGRQVCVDSFPKCVKAKIDSFRLKEKHEMPQSVKEYEYKGRKVYYIVMPCCDFFNEVYDEHCLYLGAPDGGFTGKGDGRLADFFSEAKNEKIIWKVKN